MDDVTNVSVPISKGKVASQKLHFCLRAVLHESPFYILENECGLTYSTRGFRRR